jgi:hypothetical protein
MATLNGTQIGNTYPGLIKTDDNAELGIATKRTITDGNGNPTPLKLAQEAIGLEQGTQKINVNSTNTKIEGATVITQNATATQFVTVDATSANIGGTVNYLTTNDTTAAFTGALDLSAATVTGLPASGVSSVVAGTNVTVDNTDPANPIVSASGGGGSSAELAEGQNITTGFSTLAYSIPWILSGYSTGAAKTLSANTIQLVPFYAKPGESMSEFYFRVFASVASSTMDVGLYKSYVGTSGGNKYLYPEYVTDIALNVDCSTTGQKLFTALDILFPTDAYGGQYWIGFMPDTSGGSLAKWQNWVAAERTIFNDIYRTNGTEKIFGSSTLPTGQIDLSSGASPSTDLCIDFAWKYKS